MRFLEFQNELRPLLVFNTMDIKKIDKKFNQVNLSIWQERNYINKLAKGLYTFSDYIIQQELLYFAANKIIDPSYISCESALSYYGMLEMEDHIVSVNPIRSHTYSSACCDFKFHKGKPDILKDYVLEKYNQHYFKIASPEKALVDFFFFNPQYQTRSQIENLKFLESESWNKITRFKIKSIANSYGNNKLDRRINNFTNMYVK